MTRLGHFAKRHLLPIRFLVRLVKIKPGQDVFPVPKSTPPFVLGQRPAAAIPPSMLRQEFVPDFDLLRTRPATALEAPLQEFLVGAATKDPLDQCRILDAEKPGASR